MLEEDALDKQRQKKKRLVLLALLLMLIVLAMIPLIEQPDSAPFTVVAEAPIATSPPSPATSSSAPPKSTSISNAPTPVLATTVEPAVPESTQVLDITPTALRIATPTEEIDSSSSTGGDTPHQSNQITASAEQAEEFSPDSTTTAEFTGPAEEKTTPAPDESNEAGPASAAGEDAADNRDGPSSPAAPGSSGESNSTVLPTEGAEAEPSVTTGEVDQTTPASPDKDSVEPGQADRSSSPDETAEASTSEPTAEDSPADAGGDNITMPGTTSTVPANNVKAETSAEISPPADLPITGHLSVAKAVTNRKMIGIAAGMVLLLLGMGATALSNKKI